MAREQSPHFLQDLFGMGASLAVLRLFRIVAGETKMYVGFYPYSPRPLDNFRFYSKTGAKRRESKKSLPVPDSIVASPYSL
jgi:hypothetical protein